MHRLYIPAKYGRVRPNLECYASSWNRINTARDRQTLDDRCLHKCNTLSGDYVVVVVVVVDRMFAIVVVDEDGRYSVGIDVGRMDSVVDGGSVTVDGEKQWMKWMVDEKDFVHWIPVVYLFHWIE